MQSTNVFVENVFVVCVAGQCTVHCIIQAEEFLRVLIKSLMRSLSSFLQHIDCVNHGRKGGELHLQALFQSDPWGGITPGLQVREHRSTSFQSGNAVFSPMLIIGRIGSLTGSILNLAYPLKEILAFLSIKMRDSVKPKPQACLSLLTCNGRNPRPVRRSILLQQAIELCLLLLNCGTEILIHVNQLLDSLFQHAVLMGRSNGRGNRGVR